MADRNKFSASRLSKKRTKPELIAALDRVIAAEKQLVLAESLQLREEEHQVKENQEKMAEMEKEYAAMLEMDAEMKKKLVEMKKGRDEIKQKRAEGDRHLAASKLKLDKLVRLKEMMDDAARAKQLEASQGKDGSQGVSQDSHGNVVEESAAGDGEQDKHRDKDDDGAAQDLSAKLYSG